VHLIESLELSRGEIIQAELDPGGGQSCQQQRQQQDGQSVHLQGISIRCSVFRVFLDCSATRAGGTGSNPPGWKGWHLSIRLSASQLPRRAPCSSSASAA